MGATEPNRKLTPKQAKFVGEYLIDLNATQAALRAGYSKKTSFAIGRENLHKPAIAEALKAAIDQRAEKTGVDAAYVLRQAQKLHERCMQEIAPYTDRKGNQIHDEDGNSLYVFNANGAAKALEIIGKHVDIQAFRENVQHSTPEGQPLIKIEFVKVKAIALSDRSA